MPKKEEGAKEYQLSCGHKKRIRNRGEYKDELYCFGCRKMVKIGEPVA